MRPCGGDEEVRTPDPLRARQVLSQLSYTPRGLLTRNFEDVAAPSASRKRLRPS